MSACEDVFSRALLLFCINLRFSNLHSGFSSGDIIIDIVNLIALEMFTNSP